MPSHGAFDEFLPRVRSRASGGAEAVTATRGEERLMAVAAPTQRYCGRCGAPLAPGAGFCGRCGTPVLMAAVAPRPVYSYAPAPRAAYPAATQPRLGPALIAGGLIAVLVVVGLVVG